MSVEPVEALGHLEDVGLRRAVVEFPLHRQGQCQQRRAIFERLAAEQVIADLRNRAIRNLQPERRARPPKNIACDIAQFQARFPHALRHHELARCIGLGRGQQCDELSVENVAARLFTRFGERTIEYRDRRAEEEQQQQAD